MFIASAPGMICVLRFLDPKRRINRCVIKRVGTVFVRIVDPSYAGRTNYLTTICFSDFVYPFSDVNVPVE